MYDDVDIPEPDTFRDDLVGRAEVIRAVRMRMMDLDPIVDLKSPVPAGLDEDGEISWRYQRYIKDYLRVVASIDDNVGRMLDHLDRLGLTDNTIVVYTSDQGFFLGDHGWFDKRLMYEESLTMPFLIRYPARVAAGGSNSDIVTNVDFAPTFLELAELDAPSHLQGRSIVALLGGDTPFDWPQSMYYRYWMHNDGSHSCPAHYGVRTKTHKLICYYNDPLDQVGANGPASPVEWELFDLLADPLEIDNVYANPGTESVTESLLADLARIQVATGDTPYPGASGSESMT
jgi:arylsulfatase A-like enzyme